MCGRYTLTAEQEALAAALEVDRLFLEHRPRWNVAPTQEAPVVRVDDQGPRLDPLRWGLVPWWADDPRIGNRLINARSETVARQRAFRDAFRRGQRCLVPVDGFYEWRNDPGGKTPHWIARPDREIFTLAGLWDRWKDPEGGQIRSFVILTTEPSPAVAPIHDRMPLVVPPGDRTLWLDPEADPERVEGLLRSMEPGELEAWPVSTLVNRPANDGPGLLEGVPGRRPERSGDLDD